jgi:fused signal recognition particle receptor
MLEAFIAEASAFLLSLTLEQELLLSSAAFLSFALGLLRLRRKPSDKTKEASAGLISAEIKEKEVIAQDANFSKGLVHSRGFLISRLTSWINSNKNLDQKNSTLLEEILISADLGVAASQRIVGNVLANSKSNQVSDLMSLLKSELIQILSSDKSPEINLANHSPMIILIVGVNGAGKTTTIAKISKLFKQEGKRVLVAAADTFRAAAVGQLSHWANRIGVDIEYTEGENIKPGTIVYDAITRLKKEKQDVLIIDTAGRLHNRVNLMNELEGIKKSIQREFPEAPHETLLVLDGSSGQNALMQAREFNERSPLTGIVITKLDGTSKGGIVVAIRDELKIDIRYIGLGEGEDDLILFDAKEFTNALLGEQDLSIEDSGVRADTPLNSEELNTDLVTENTVTERKVVRKRKEINGD